jgi:hypothetical protein
MALLDGQWIPAQQPRPRQVGRSGVFQQAFLTGTYLPEFDGANGLGFGELEAGIVLGFPFFRRDTPLVVTPRIGVHWLDGAAKFDLPDALYDTAIEFRHLRRFAGGPWAMDAAVTLGYYSDFEHDQDDALRPTARALAVYEAASGAKWVAGAAYLNRDDVSVLPVGGVIYQPTPDWNLELIAPRPRISRRLLTAPGDETWVYLGGEFAGGVWAIEHPQSRALDVVSESEYRILLGYERKLAGGLGRRYELGYVFGRELQFESGLANVDLDDTMFLRAGLTY